MPEVQCGDRQGQATAGAQRRVAELSSAAAAVEVSLTDSSLDEIIQEFNIAKSRRDAFRSVILSKIDVTAAATQTEMFEKRDTVDAHSTLTQQTKPNAFTQIVPRTKSVVAADGSETVPASKAAAVQRLADELGFHFTEPSFRKLPYSIILLIIEFVELDLRPSTSRPLPCKTAAVGRFASDETRTLYLVFSSLIVYGLDSNLTKFVVERMKHLRFSTNRPWDDCERIALTRFTRLESLDMQIYATNGVSEVVQCAQKHKHFARLVRGITLVGNFIEREASTLVHFPCIRSLTIECQLNDKIACAIKEAKSLRHLDMQTNLDTDNVKLLADLGEHLPSLILNCFTGTDLVPLIGEENSSYIVFPRNLRKLEFLTQYGYRFPVTLNELCSSLSRSAPAMPELRHLCFGWSFDSYTMRKTSLEMWNTVFQKLESLSLSIHDCSYDMVCDLAALPCLQRVELITDEPVSSRCMEPLTKSICDLNEKGQLTYLFVQYLGDASWDDTHVELMGIGTENCGLRELKLSGKSVLTIQCLSRILACQTLEVLTIEPMDISWILSDDAQRTTVALACSSSAKVQTQSNQYLADVLKVIQYNS